MMFTTSSIFSFFFLFGTIFFQLLFFTTVTVPVEGLSSSRKNTKGKIGNLRLSSPSSPYLLKDSSDALDCDASDEALKKARGYVCSSLLGNTPGGNEWCPSDITNADCDWPTQAEYMQNFMNLLTSPSTCFNTSYMKDSIDWLDGPFSDPNTSGSYMWTYLVFQVQYYDMPRKEGTRIESPGTLGRKCWAMAFEKQVWNPDAWTSTLTANNLPLPKQFITNYETAIPLTMDLCNKVQQNCFQNTTYDPSKDGTCKLDIDEFHFGFDRENLKRHNMVKYPFE